jgi:hypothetical protein
MYQLPILLLLSNSHLNKLYYNYLATKSTNCCSIRKKEKIVIQVVVVEFGKIIILDVRIIISVPTPK